VLGIVGPLLISAALAADFGQLPATVPSLPPTEPGDEAQALQLLMLPFMPDHVRFATLEALAAAPRSKKVDRVFRQCRGALSDGIRPGEKGLEGPAKRQQKGIVFDCLDAATELARAVGVERHKGKAAEMLSAAAEEPMFGHDACPALMATLDVKRPGPLAPDRLPRRGDHEAFGSVVVHVDGTGKATPLGRLYGDEAAARACFAAVDGPWRAPTDGAGQPAELCVHMRCAW